MDITFSCSQCGQNIVIDEAGAGMELPCPGCQKTIVVPSPQSETPVILSQLCPKCERAWPEQERVCDHCGTSLKKEEPVPTLAPVAVEATVTPRIKSPAPRPVTPPRLPVGEVHASSPAPTVAVAPPSGEEDRYQCQSSACGETWFESQLRYQDLGRKKVRVCPKCGLGVSKLYKQMNFWANVPKAFIYPFKGVGVWILVLGAPLFTLATSVGFGLLLLLPKLALFGYFGMMLINVIRTSADNEEEPLDWPSLEGRMEFMLVGLQIILSTLLIFGPGILCAFQAGISIFGKGADGTEIAGLWAIAAMSLLCLGVVYYPMGLLGMAMFDSIKGVNPLLIVPAIFKVPLQYLLVLVLLVVLWLVRIPVAIVTNLFHFPWSMGVVLVGDAIILYTLVVSARLLGLLYRANADRIGWFT